MDGERVAVINPNLTSGIDLTRAHRLQENLGVSFMGDTKGGPFDIDATTAGAMLSASNPDGRSNVDVSARALTDSRLGAERPRRGWSTSARTVRA